MSLTVDSPIFLVQQVALELGMYRDILAFIGFCYASKLTLNTTWSVLVAVWVHFVSRLRGNTDLVHRYGKWAVVTGCTDGIGKAYAQELARRGMSLVLVSRSMTKLEKVAKDIEINFGVETKIITVDFSEGRSIYKMISNELEDMEIGMLVNNVGVMYKYPMQLEEVSEADIWDHININIAATTMMTKIVIPQMVSRKRGAIINLSSSSAIGPLPLLTIYSASKVYVEYFSRALNWEYRNKGITVQTLIPFYVATNMTSYSERIGTEGIMTPTASTYAHNAISTLGIADCTTGYWSHGIQHLICTSWPSWLWISLGSILQEIHRSDHFKKLKSLNLSVK